MPQPPFAVVAGLSEGVAATRYYRAHHRAGRDTIQTIASYAASGTASCAVSQFRVNAALTCQPPSYR
jgi:hypothetical protein